jgi:hypothetical protein
MISDNVFVDLGVIVVIMALAAILTIFVMRSLIRVSVRKELIENSVLTTADGIEYTGYFLIGVGKIKYQDIRSVELHSYHKVVFKATFGGYGIAARRIPPCPFQKILVIRVKNPNPIEYFFFAPKNAEEVFNRIIMAIGT